MWLDNLKELKKEKGMSVKQIAEKTNLPERTVSRIFSGDTGNPYVDTLHRIVTALGGSLDCILADTKVIVDNAYLKVLQDENNKLKEELDRIIAENALLSAEVATLNNSNCALSSENDMLRLKLEHKEELLALHNYYNKLRA